MGLLEKKYISAKLVQQEKGRVRFGGTADAPDVDCGYV